MSIVHCANCEESYETGLGGPGDNPIWNTFPVFGAFLCEKCVQVELGRRHCADCGSEHRDPSYGEFRHRDRRGKFTVPPLVEKHPFFQGNPYLCRWCALFRGDMEFIEKRTPPIDRDKRMLTAELGLESNATVQYLFLPRHKKDLEDSGLNYFKGEDATNKGKKGFFIRYTGYVWRVDKEPPKEIHAYGFFINHPDNACKIVKIRRVQFFHPDCQGYAETMLDTQPRAINLKNLNPDKTHKEAETLMGARSLIFELERKSNGGRRPGFPQELETIQSDYLYVCACHIYLDTDDARPSGRDFANFYGRNRSSLYRHLKSKFQISFSDLMSQCESRVKPMEVENLPGRFRFYIQQKHKAQRAAD